MLDKLRSLEWFREYEAEVKADARVAAAEAKAAVATVADKLTEFLTLRDAPTEHALQMLRTCST